MTFSERCKREITKTEYEKSCCLLSHLYGMLCFSKEFSGFGMTFSSEHPFIVKHFKDCFHDCGFSTGKLVATHAQKSRTLSLSDRAGLERIMSDLGYTGSETKLRLNAENLMCDQCFGAFLGGAFISGGTVTDPKTNYHLEFSTHRSAFLADFCELLSQHDLPPKVSERGYSKIIYFKDSSLIEDILAMSGAVSCSLSLMNEKIIKDVRNNVNRRLNCESANIDKQIAASAGVRKDIELLKQKSVFSSLDPRIQAVAELRIKNPELSLGDLGGLLDPPLAKSAVYYRLSRITEIAKQLKEQDAD